MQKMVLSWQNLRGFTNETIYGDLDIERLIGERRHYTTYDVSAAPDGLYRSGI